MDETNQTTGTPAENNTPTPEAKQETPAPASETPAKQGAPAPTPQPAATKTEAPVLNFDEVKMPEDLGPLTDSFKSLATDIGLSTENTQKVVDYYQKNIAAPIEQARNEMIDKWVKDSKTEFGDEGIEVAKKAYNAIATPALKQILSESGLANNPEIIRVFNIIGKKMSEGSLVLGEGSAPPRSPGSVLFSKSISERR